MGLQNSATTCALCSKGHAGLPAVRSLTLDCLLRAGWYGHSQGGPYPIPFPCQVGPPPAHDSGEFHACPPACLPAGPLSQALTSWEGQHLSSGSAPSSREAAGSGVGRKAGLRVGS